MRNPDAGETSRDITLDDGQKRELRDTLRRVRPDGDTAVRDALRNALEGEVVSSRNERRSRRARRSGWRWSPTSARRTRAVGRSGDRSSTRSTRGSACGGAGLGEAAGEAGEEFVEVCSPSLAVGEAFRPGVEAGYVLVESFEFGAEFADKRSIVATVIAPENRSGREASRSLSRWLVAKINFCRARGLRRSSSRWVLRR
jgi:hypothetical protein